MMSEPDDNFSPGLSVELELPLVWHRRDPMGEAPCNRAANLAILNYLEARDEAGAAVAAREQSNNTDLARLEHKLDLMLNMLGLLLEQQQVPVPARRLRLSTDELGWQGSLPLEAGAALWLEVFLEPASRPLCLAGELGTNQDEQVRIHLQLQDPAVRDAFEKWIFRQHRRAIARTAGQS